MKQQFSSLCLLAGLLLSGLAHGQRYDDRRDDGRRDDGRYGSRVSGADRRYDESDMRKAYDLGFREGKQSAEQDAKKTDKTDRQDRRSDYKNFTFGVYAGANSTRFEGEDVDGNRLRGRLGYQLGFFLRGGGRVFGQVGAEYLTSSSNFYTPGDGASVDDINANIDQEYLHLPAYIGVKLAQSRRGISAVRLQFGAEYAVPVGVKRNDFDLQQSDFRDGTVNGLVGLGFDAGPLMLGLTYHHGFADVLKESNNSKRRILGVNVGLKF